MQNQMHVFGEQGGALLGATLESAHSVKSRSLVGSLRCQTCKENKSNPSPDQVL